METSESYESGGLSDVLIVGEKERVIALNDHLERDVGGDETRQVLDDATVLRRLLDETMAEAAEENQEAKCFIVSIKIDQHKAQEVIRLWAYREVSHAVAHLVLSDFQPTLFHGEIGGYPDEWEWFPPSGIIRKIMPSPGVVDSSSTKAYDALPKAMTHDIKQSTSTDMV